MLSRSQGKKGIDICELCEAPISNEISPLVDVTAHRITQHMFWCQMHPDHWIG